MKLKDLIQQLEQLQYNAGEDARIMVSYDSGTCKADIKEVEIKQSLFNTDACDVIIKI